LAQVRQGCRVHKGVDLAMTEAKDLIKRVLRSKEDYFDILGVDRGADDEVLKKAYKRLALRLHPDKCQEEGAEEAFKKVGEAFSVLSDPQKRRQYEQFGAEGVRNGGDGAAGMSPQDLFETFFPGFGGPGGGFGPGFHMSSGGGGFQAFSFSSGGAGGPTIHFSTGPGFGGGFGSRGGQSTGLHERRRRPTEDAAQEERRREPPQQGTLLSLTMVFLVFALLGILVLAQMVVRRILQSRLIFVIPAMAFFVRREWTLLAGVAILYLVGVF